MTICMRPAARDQALDAVRQFHAEHGRLPRQQEWSHATADRPCTRTIERRWGWRSLLDRGDRRRGGRAGALGGHDR
jgi:hypothetical protein